VSQERDGGVVGPALVTARPAVIAEEASKTFLLPHTRIHHVKDHALRWFRPQPTAEMFTALDRVSLRVNHGESVALVGRNGSGKSTLLKIVAGIHHATGGRLLVRRGLRIATMIELGVGFHPELTGEENVYLNAAIHGLSRDQIDAMYPSVVAYAELHRFMDAPIKTYSSGMVMRLGFAIGMQLDPDMFLLDEIFAVGDEGFQQKCMRSMREFREGGRTMFFVSHSAEAVRDMCGRAVVLEHGRLTFDGEVDAGIRHYRRLIGQEPSLEGPGAAGLPPPSIVDQEPADDRHLGGIAAEVWEGGAEAQLAFLRGQGLKPEHHVLDLGCGPLRAGTRLLAFLEPGHYVGVDHDAAAIEAGCRLEAPRAGVDPGRGRCYVADATDLSAIDGTFDVIVAIGLVECLDAAQVARMMAAALRRLSPAGRLFIAFLEASGPALFERIERPGGAHSTLEGPVRHFDYGVLARLAEAAGGRAERVGEWGDPQGQSMMVVTPDV
jgi:ABC-2 type transport system ATP-binding protein